MPTNDTRFDRDTAVSFIEAGRYAGHMDRGWWIVNGPNGGYVAAVLLRTLLAEVDDPARLPRSLTIHYLRPPAEGPVEIHTVKERVGRGLTTASARLFQGDKLMAIAIGAFAGPRAGFPMEDLQMPDLPRPETCQKLRDKYQNTVELQKRYDSRWGLGEPFGSGSSRALVGGWIRFEEPRLVDSLAVAAFTDSFPPAVFSRVTPDVAIGPVPTIDLTIHFRAGLPLAGAGPSDYAAVVFRSTVAREGFVEEDSEVWSESGVLLAQSRQLALIGG
jgi:acyl-CoA thioesterase